MSYDFGVGDYDGNYTWNLAPLFYDTMPGGIRGLNGLTGARARQRLTYAIDLAKSWGGEKLRKYDPDNGWGSSERAIQVLGEFAEACARHPRSKVYVF